MQIVISSGESRPLWMRICNTDELKRVDTSKYRSVESAAKPKKNTTPKLNSTLSIP